MNRPPVLRVLRAAAPARTLLSGSGAGTSCRGLDAILQDPIEQDYGVRDAAFRDPAGHMIRLQQTGGSTTTERN